MKRKIALIGDEATRVSDPGGGEGNVHHAYAWEVARNLSQIGYEVDVFTPQGDESQTQREERLENVRLIPVPSELSVSRERQTYRGSLPDATHGFADYVLRFCSSQEQPYDLIHAISWESGWAAVELKAALGTPFVITFPGHEEARRPLQRDESSFPAQHMDAEDRILRDADGIVAESPQDREELVSLYDADPSYIAQIPSGLNGENRKPGELLTQNSNANRQRFTSLLVEFYENVLAVRRVAVQQADPAALGTSQLDDPDRLQMVEHAFETAIQTLRETRVALGEKILEAANLMIACLHRGGKIMVCGAGGAEADARQFSAELLGRSRLSGYTGLPVLLLAGDMRSSAYPADEADHETVFSRQVEGLGRPGDLLFGIAREEDLACLAEAFRSARLHNLTCLSLTGPDAEHLASQTEVALVVPGSSARRTREVQLLLLDVLCDLVEEQLAGTHSIPAADLYNASSALRLLKGLVQ